MTYIKTSIGIFLALAASRFIPHPPNFTSLLALSFYVPAILGRKYIVALVICFMLTDVFIGYHTTTLFTWGSVAIIGYTTKFFLNSSLNRLFGAFSATLIFFLLSNFGVWVSGTVHGVSNLNLLETYIIAIPFYGNTLISTMIFSLIIENLISLKQIKIILKKKLI